MTATDVATAAVLRMCGELGKAASNGPRAACAPAWLPLTDVTCGSAGVSQPVLAPQLPPLSRLVSGLAGWS